MYPDPWKAVRPLTTEGVRSYANWKSAGYEYFNPLNFDIAREPSRPPIPTLSTDDGGAD